MKKQTSGRFVLLPMPQQVTEREGSMHLTWHTRIVLQDTEPSACLYAQMLQDEIRSAAGLDLRIVRGRSCEGDLILSVDESFPADHDEVRVDESGIILLGGSDEALLHAAVTLMQLVQQHGALLPCCRIEDWPDLAHRGYYQDVSRGRIPTLETLKKTADLLCRYKINEWQLYIEHTYLFRGLSEAWRDDEPLEAEEILELDAYCRARHIELVPSLASFGHMYQILSTQSCEALCELPDAEKIPFTYTYSGMHHTLNVSNPDSLTFIQAMIQEYSQLFTSRRFNICCDETFDLGRGRSAGLAEKEPRGSTGLYLKHVGALCRWLLGQGITPMFWGDILAREPSAYADIPEGVICLNWGYLPNQREDEIRDLAAMGAVQYVCPGVCTWNMFLPLLENSFMNIRTMCGHAHRYAAIGLLNTDWGDWGHICHPAFSIPGILYGAAFSWNAGTAAGLSFDEVNDAVSLLAYGDRTGSFMRAFRDMTCHENFYWNRVVRWIEAKDEDGKRSVLEEALEDLKRVPEENAAMDAAELALDKSVPAMRESAREIVQALHVSAEGVKLFNTFGCVLAAREGLVTCDADPYELASHLEWWYHEFLRIWHTVSRHGTVERTRKIVNACADVLRGREMKKS